MSGLQDTPGYSFIIPAYNDVEGLARHLAYFADCKTRVQLVVVDDASQDGTPELMEQARLPDNVRLCYHRMGQNMGPSAARNQGLRLAEEDWVLFLDADDLLAPCFFSIMQLATRIPACDFLMFKYHLAHGKDQRFTYDMHRIDRKFFSARSYGVFPMSHLSLGDCPEAAGTVNFPWNKLYRRAFLLRAGITFPEALRMQEDILPHWRSFLASDLFAVLDWAPPLITHFEIKKQGRATQYIGEQRLQVFDSLRDLEQQVVIHPEAVSLAPVFAAFCEDLFQWLTLGLFEKATAEQMPWRARYREACDQFWASSSVSDLRPSLLLREEV